MRSRWSRRRFLRGAASVGAGAWFLPVVSAASYRANEKLGVALVGCGTRGRGLLEAVRRVGENVVALCDVNEQRAAQAFAMAPEVPKHLDYRKMLREVQGIDAVVVATSGHHLAPCSALSMRLGKPVFCEKPLAKTVLEARRLREILREANVATQMGNQGAATDAFRQQVEILQTGGLGEVREVYVWQEMGNQGLQPLPTEAETPPRTLAWDLYLGPRAERPYNRLWTRWAAWREFGFGQLGNWGSHASAAAFRGLKLDTLWDAADAEPSGAPQASQAAPSRRIRVQAKSAETNAHCFPEWEAIDFEIPARGDMPPLVIHWFAGRGGPGFPENVEKLAGREIGGSGCLTVGTRGKILASGHNSAYSVVGEDRGRGVGRPEPFLPRHGSHEREWFDAIRGKLKQPFSNFDIASRQIEMLMLGNVATLLGRPIEYDPLTGTCPNDEVATAALDLEHREGWTL
jgi:hypothetical protein